jgi:hypothetical protein
MREPPFFLLSIRGYGKPSSLRLRSPVFALWLKVYFTRNRTGTFRRIRLKHWPTHLHRHAVVRIGLEDNLYVTEWEPTTEPSQAAPARALRSADICFACSSRFASPFTYANTRGKSAGFHRGMMLPCGATPIRSITERPSLAPSSFTRRLISSSCESSLPRRGDDGLTTFRHCHRVG